jgi:hypothetical protein
MPRTTVDIDASVLRELKKRQVRERKTLGQLISELLAKAIEVGERDDSGETVQLGDIETPIAPSTRTCCGRGH